MCLDIVFKNAALPDSVIGYKVVIKRLDNNYNFIFFYNNNKPKINKVHWNVAACYTIPAFNATYHSGFHVFKTLNSAREYKMNNADFGNLAIIKVKCVNILAIGLQLANYPNKRVCLVAEKMKFIREVL